MVSKYPEHADVFELKQDHIDNIKSAYNSDNVVYVSVQIGNRLINQINEYIKRKEQV